MSDKIDLNISGASVMPGGDYGTVRISGSGKINGNLRADSLRCSGAAKVEGDVVTGELECSGGCKIEGNAEVEQAHISGGFKVNGSLSGGSFRVSGAIKAEGLLHCQQLLMSGELKVGQDVEAEEVHLTGCAEIGGLLNADTIEIKSYGSSDIKEIGCSSLTVRKNAKENLVRRFFGYDIACALEAGTIEADRADLEYTTADVVRGRDIVIGPGCKIRRIEYTGTCQAADGTVTEMVKI